MTGITRAKAASIIAEHFGTSASHIGGCYDTYTAPDTEGRTWKLVSDSSIIREHRNDDNVPHTYSVELVTPICCYEDIETLQQIVRKLRHSGAKVNNSCGIHIHVDAAPHNAHTLRNICNIMAAKEDLLFKALQVDDERRRYCDKADSDFIEKLNRHRPKSLDAFENLWYRGDCYRKHNHYDHSRYRALNLHAVFSKGTVEFRMFNSTLHAGEIKSYIQLCLAISQQALVQTRASHAKSQPDNDKYSFRVWLLRLGLIGPEFETARHHLLKHLEGNISWRDPAQAVRQKERMAASRAAAATHDTAPAAEDESEEDSDSMVQTM